MSTRKLDLEGRLALKLKRLHKPPKALFATGQGDIEELLSHKVVAVVGTRRPTPYGRAVTAQLVEALASRGVTIVSGLALGVDGLAHQHCLEAGGKTIAVLPTSLKHIYPRTNQQLATKITETGLLVTEYQSDQSPMHHQFIERNRIIAALADSILIPEAAEKSGSLHTACFALEMGINVYVVPGNITSPMSGGTNRLIASGATPVLSADSLLQHLGLKSSKTSFIYSEDSGEMAIIELLKTGVKGGDELQAESALPPAEYSRAMTMLELRGDIRPLGADKWSL